MTETTALCHDEAPGPLGTGMYCGRPAGHGGDHRHGAYSWASTALAEGVRERLRGAVLKAGREVDENALTAIIDALARLLDPADLPARMLTAARQAGLAYDRSAAKFDWDAYNAAITDAALSVRWEAAVQEAAEADQWRARARHAEGELSARRDHETRWEREKARADRAAADLDAAIADHAAERTALEERVERLRGERDTAQNRITALEANGAELLARVEQAEATIERVRALRDDWARGRAPTAAAELSAALDGGE